MRAFCQAVLYKAAGKQSMLDADDWYRATRPGRRLRQAIATSYEHLGSPRWSVVVAFAPDEASEVDEIVRAVQQQVGIRWRLILLHRGSLDEQRLRLLAQRAASDPRIELPAGLDEPWAETIVRAAAQSDYLCMVDADSRLEPLALHRLGEALKQERADLAYGDAVVFDRATGRALEVLARPAFSYEFFLSTGYFADCYAFRAEVLRAATEQPARFHGPFDWCLQLIERAERVSHTPCIVSRRLAPNASDDAPEQERREHEEQRAVEKHLARLGQRGEVRRAARGVRDILYQRPASARVAVVVPTHNGHELLKQCLESLERTVPRELADVIVVDHASDEPAALDYLSSLERRHRVVRIEGAFNFSYLMNRGAAAAGGGYSHYLLLNNDIEAIGQGWLEHMLALAARGRVGIVGATLLYSDRTIQHAGAILGLRGLAGHFFAGLPCYGRAGMRLPGYQQAQIACREVSAVTGACLLVRADVYEQLGGMDEEIAVGYGDVDLCLRCRGAGYQVLMDGQAVLLHHESATRGKTAWDPHPEDTRRFLRRHIRLIRAGDPYYSPLLSCVLTQSQLAAPRREPAQIIARTLPVALPRASQSDSHIGKPGDDGRIAKPAA